MEGILKQLKQQEGLQGPLAAEIWDQGDAVGEWQCRPGDNSLPPPSPQQHTHPYCMSTPTGAWYGSKLGAVLFPTASTLDALRKLAEKEHGPELLLIINPQWELDGGLVSGV